MSLSLRQKLKIHIGVNVFTPDKELAEMRAKTFVDSLNDEEVEYTLGLAYFRDEQPDEKRRPEV